MNTLTNTIIHPKASNAAKFQKTRGTIQRTMDVQGSRRFSRRVTGNKDYIRGNFVLVCGGGVGGRWRNYLRGYVPSFDVIKCTTTSLRGCCTSSPPPLYIYIYIRLPFFSTDSFSPSPPFRPPCVPAPRGGGAGGNDAPRRASSAAAPRRRCTAVTISNEMKY